MKTWNGYGSSKSKCIYCNKTTPDYLIFEQGSIKIEVYAHWGCRKDTDLNVMKKVLKDIKGNFK